MISMAADSDGLYGMVSNPGDDQPIDLSRGTKKSTRLMPPLIPISMLPSGYHQRRFSNREPLGAKRNAEPSDRLAPTVEESTSDMPTARDDDWRESQSSPKRTRLSGEDGWGGTLRLDRARSVPQLAPIPSLQRYKSLSESRIPEAAAEAEAKASLGPDTSSEIVRALELKHRLNLLGHNIDLTEILIYLSNYRQMYQNCQARELLRRLALQHQQDNQQVGTAVRQPNEEKIGNNAQVSSAVSF
ncbi:hypothetical protein C0J52_19320 [Blattella germanica]|nr:hypothetical protein C0J52_19320 [Blattella germanica]